MKAEDTTFYIVCDDIAWFVLCHCKAKLCYFPLCFCAVAFQHPVTPFPGVIVKVFGSINPMWSWEWLKSHTFDLGLNFLSLTFQCWAPKRDYEEKQAPHPFQPWHWCFHLLFPVSKSHNPESLGIRGRVRHQRYSYTDSVPWQPKNPLILQEGVQTNP